MAVAPALSTIAREDQTEEGRHQCHATDNVDQEAANIYRILGIER